MNAGMDNAQEQGRMKIFIVDAFATEIFRGNQAGVALLEEGEAFPRAAFMQNLAAELKHSETAYVKRLGENEFALRYFTPLAEVDVCGHATVSAFTALREEGHIGAGAYRAQTLAGELPVEVRQDSVWMDMAPPRQLRVLDREHGEELYAAFGLEPTAKPENLEPAVVHAGLSDIVAPVKNATLLNAARMNSEKVRSLSRKHGVTGVHMFCLNRTPDVTARCRNFAPLYGIEEEAATGTSTGALTFYLRQRGSVEEGIVQTFVQGEAMGKPSVIQTMIRGPRVQVGGAATMALECRFYRA